MKQVLKEFASVICILSVKHFWKVFKFPVCHPKEERNLAAASDMTNGLLNVFIASPLSTCILRKC